MDSKGVSPMIATIVLIAIVFAVAAILALSLASAPQPEVIFGGQLAMENIENGRDVITIKHVYGDRANDALKAVKVGGTHPNETDNYWDWKNLELRINGVVVSHTADQGIIQVISEGKIENVNSSAVYDGDTISLIVGDKIVVKLSSPLTIGDKVLLKWVPKNQSLVEKEVTF